MKKCQNCGYALDDSAEFCTSCGAAVNSQQANQGQQTYQPQQAYQSQQPVNPVFVDYNENIVATLGNGVLQNVLSGGGLSTINATLTDKRLYVSGKCLESLGLGWMYARISRIIEVEDITGTGFVYVSKPSRLVIGIILALLSLTMMFSEYTIIVGIILLVFGLIFIAAFFLGKKNVFQIEYAGGRIGFDVKWIKPEMAAAFQKQVHIVKRNRKNACKTQ